MEGKRTVAPNPTDDHEARTAPLIAAEAAVLADEQTLTRRRLVRLATAGAAGMAATGYALERASAQDATPDPAPDPEADPEAGEDEEATPAPGGTPVGSAGELVVYSGRNEELVGDLVPRIEGGTGVDLEVEYAGTSELAAQILEEGENTPAGLFLAQDAGALGALAAEGRLQELPAELLERVDPRFRSPDGLWVGISGRSRVLVYNTDQVTEDRLPASVLDLPTAGFEGQVGWAPTNASFQAFVTALRVLEGDEGARAWLEAMQGIDPVVFESNGDVVRAVGRGEIQVGLVNHYYLYEIQAEEQTELPIANHFFQAGDPGSLVNVAGVGILAGTDQAEQAEAVVDYLLTEPAQAYFAEQTFEYPLIQGVPLAEGLRPLEEVQGPEIDLSDLADLEGTLALLTELGII